MSDETKCKSMQERIVALVLDELDAPAVQEVRRHTEMCESCKGFLEALSEQEKDVQAAFDIIARDVELIGGSLIDRLDKRSQQTTEVPGQKPARPVMNEVKKMILVHRRLSGVAAGLLFAMAIGAAIYLGVGTAGRAYALEQTIKALETVGFLHLTMNDEETGITDERWIEVGSDGFQHRYRQESAGMGMEILIVDDRETVFDWRKDKNTVVLWSPKDKWYQWIANLREFFKDLQGAPGSLVIEQDSQYKGRRAHLVRRLKLDQEIYIDPETKLPIAIGKYEITYEDPPEGIFEIPEIPEGVAVVDKRPGAPKTAEPDWMKEERQADRPFYEGRKALSAGDYDQAVEQLKEAISLSPLRNWAHFWLAEAYRELGQYDLAIEEYTWVTGVVKKLGLEARYANLARGLTYRAKGEEEQARNDFARVLNVMITALRNPEGCKMFDYADDPLHRGKNLSDPERISNMIARLREVTGQNFGFDPAGALEQNEQAIAAWEHWWTQHAADYRVTPEK